MGQTSLFRLGLCDAPSMPRSPRADEAGGHYHALNRANLGAKVFRKGGDFVAFEQVFYETLQLYQLGTLPQVVSHFLTSHFLTPFALHPLLQCLLTAGMVRLESVSCRLKNVGLKNAQQRAKRRGGTAVLRWFWGATVSASAIGTKLSVLNQQLNVPLPIWLESGVVNGFNDELRQLLPERYRKG